MTDEKTDETPAVVVEEAKEKTVDVVEEVTPEPVEEASEHATDDIPEWGVALRNKVSELEAIVSAPVEEGLPEMPNHGHEIKDEKPGKLPWTHRKLF
jgi:hypothetical protein